MAGYYYERDASAGLICVIITVSFCMLMCFIPNNDYKYELQICHQNDNLNKNYNTKNVYDCIDLLNPNDIILNNKSNTMIYFESEFTMKHNNVTVPFLVRGNDDLTDMDIDFYDTLFVNSSRINVNLYNNNDNNILLKKNEKILKVCSRITKYYKKYRRYDEVYDGKIKVKLECEKN